MLLLNIFTHIYYVTLQTKRMEIIEQFSTISMKLPTL